MQNQLFLNGFVVQGQPINWIAKASNYRGAAYRLSWPLSATNTPQARKLSMMTDEWFMRSYGQGHFSLWVIPDTLFVKRYLTYCDSMGIEHRLLLCKSERIFPRASIDNKLKNYLRFLGWDYLTSALDYSPLLDELYSNMLGELEPLRGRLNDSGLFPDQESLRTYIAIRNSLINRGENLEHGLDFVEMCLYEIDPIHLR